MAPSLSLILGPANHVQEHLLNRLELTEGNTENVTVVVPTQLTVQAVLNTHQWAAQAHFTVGLTATIGNFNIKFSSQKKQMPWRGSMWMQLPRPQFPGFWYFVRGPSSSHVEAALPLS